MYIVAFRLM